MVNPTAFLESMLVRLKALRSELDYRAWTTCFYSYRGGVGRTTCALNAALGNGSGNRGVFFLDFDLEAPGVDEFESFRPDDSEQPGLMEYMRNYEASGTPPDLKDFVYKKRGVYVMRAGRIDDAYVRQLSTLDLNFFYVNDDGQRFFENLRAAVRQELGCDHMIVDSRTGLTNIGGVCLGHLADAAAFVFQPTKAHETGLSYAVRAVRERDGKPKRVPRLYVASRVREFTESNLDPSEVKLALKIVKRLEADPITEIRLGDWPNHRDHVDDLVALVEQKRNSGNPINWNEALEQLDAQDELPETEVVAFLSQLAGVYFVPSLDRVRDRHLPDSFLVPERTPIEPVHGSNKPAWFLRAWVDGARMVVQEPLSAQISALAFFLRIQVLTQKEVEAAVRSYGFLELVDMFGKTPYVQAVRARSKNTIREAQLDHGPISREQYSVFDPSELELGLIPVPPSPNR